MNARKLVVTLLLVAVLVVPGIALAAEDLTMTLHNMDVAAFPKITAHVSVPAELQPAKGSGDPRFSVLENGKRAEVLEVTRAQRQVAQEVVLVVDTSGSMRGAPIEDARNAAARFVQEVSSKADIAIVTIGNDPKVVSGFTRDPATLNAAVQSLGASGETALYDALRTAVRLPSPSAETTAARTIVLLSDGGDTTSVTSLDETLRAVQEAKTPVLAAAISSPEFNMQALELITSKSGGRLTTVQETSVLTDYFQQLAKEIGSGYLVTFRSARPEVKDLEIDISAVANGKTATVATVIPNPAYLKRVSFAGKTVEYVPANPLWMVVAVGLAFVAVALLSAGILMFVQRVRTPLDQVGYYDQAHGEGADSAGGGGASNVAGRIVGVIDSVATRSGYSGVIGAKLQRAGIQLRPAEYISLHLILVCLIGFVVQLLTDNLALSAVLVFAAAMGPLMYLNRLGRRRVAAFEEQLPDTLNLIASGLRTGWGLQQSVDLVVNETTPPISEEFRRVQIEARLGIPIERALEHMSERLESGVFEWVVTAISIQREVGGNLAEVLDTVAKSIRDRDAMKRQIDALSAEGRLSAIILTVLPFVVVGGLMLIAPEYLRGAMASPVGWLSAGLALVLLVIGIFWLRAVSRIEY